MVCIFLKLMNLKITVERLEDRYVKLHNEFSNADLRMRYFTLRCDWAGIQYRNSEKSSIVVINNEKNGPAPYGYNSDKLIIERTGRELAELEPLFSILYPLVGKNMSDVPYHRISGEDIFEPDLDHPYYLPNPVEKKNDIKTYSRKSIEDDTTTKPHHLPELVTEPKEIQPIVPEGIDNPFVDNAWISRDGDFYGDMRMSIGGVFVHIELADRLLENNIIPKSETMSPEHYLEHAGWIKLSRNEVLFFPDGDKDYTSYQIETLKKYAKVRKLDEITIGYFGKKIKVKDLDSLSICSYR